MPQFFIKKENIINNNKIEITNPSDINHISRVLRLGKNDELMLIAPDGYVYETQIKSLNKDSIITQILDKYLSNKKLNINITLAQSIIKSQKQDILIQKASELGVRTIIPMISKNTVVKFQHDKDKNSKVQRWQKISYEASKQCKKIEITGICDIIKFEKGE